MVNCVPKLGSIRKNRRDKRYCVDDERELSFIIDCILSEMFIPRDCSSDAYLLRENGLFGLSIYL